MKPASFHVQLLGSLFILWGSLTMLIGASTLALGVAAVALIHASTSGGHQVAAGLTAAAFTLLALLALIWGGIHIGVGVLLRRRRHSSRLTALVLGSIDLLLLPYGTALGVYSLTTLLREDARRLFDTVEQPAI